MGFVLFLLFFVLTLSSFWFNFVFWFCTHAWTLINPATIAGVLNGRASAFMPTIRVRIACPRTFDVFILCLHRVSGMICFCLVGGGRSSTVRFDISAPGRPYSPVIEVIDPMTELHSDDGSSD